MSLRFQVAIEDVLEFQQETRLCEGVAPSPKKGHTLCTVAQRFRNRFNSTLYCTGYAFLKCNGGWKLVISDTRDRAISATRLT